MCTIDRWHLDCFRLIHSLSTFSYSSFSALHCLSLSLPSPTLLFPAFIVSLYLLLLPLFQPFILFLYLFLLSVFPSFIISFYLLLLALYVARKCACHFLSLIILFMSTDSPGDSSAFDLPHDFIPFSFVAVSSAQIRLVRATSAPPCDAVTRRTNTANWRDVIASASSWAAQAKLDAWLADGWLARCLSNWLIRWLIGCLVDSLGHCLCIRVDCSLIMYGWFIIYVDECLVERMRDTLSVCLSGFISKY